MVTSATLAHSVRRQSVFGLILLLLLTGTAYSQSKLAPRLHDSFGQISSEDVMARLDFFAIELQKQPYAVGHIVAHGPEGETGGTGRHILNISKEYLINTRGIEPRQIEITYGGRFRDPSDVFTELWIVPAGANPPKIRRYAKELKPISGKFASGGGWDGSIEEFGYPGDVTLAALADRLRLQKESVAYLVGYSHPDAPPGAWRRVAKEKMARLTQSGIGGGRIKILFGGSRTIVEDDDGHHEIDENQVIVDYWILPSDSPAPVREGKPEKTPKTAVHIGSYEKWILSDPERARLAFEGFADPLKADKLLRVCLIVYEALPNDDPSPPFPGEPPDVDRHKLVEDWKKRLQEKFGIDENRIIILKAGAREMDLAVVDVWVVPIGAPLPDPHPNASENEVEP